MAPTWQISGPTHSLHTARFREFDTTAENILIPIGEAIEELKIQWLYKMNL